MQLVKLIPFCSGEDEKKTSHIFYLAQKDQSKKHCRCDVFSMLHSVRTLIFGPVSSVLCIGSNFGSILFPVHFFPSISLNNV